MCIRDRFGTEQNRRYHPIPGAHTICANKGVVAYRPKTDRPLKEGEGYGVWSFIAISLSADRDFAADLFIEDAGVWTENDNEEDMIAFLEQHRKAIVLSLIHILNELMFYIMKHIVFTGRVLP